MPVKHDSAMEAHWRAFGKWLEQKRIAAGFNATEAAQRAQMTLTQWSRIENGESGTRRATIPRIAFAVQVNEREAYLEAGFVPPVEHQYADEDEDDFLRLKRLLDDLPAERRRKAVDAFEMLLTAR